MNYISRPYYLRQLGRWRDRDVIKVITGVRRCGKSTVLQMFRDELRKTGVSDGQMIVLNFDDPDTPEFPTWRDVWNYIKPRLKTNVRMYVFLDEVQRISEFEKLVDGLHSRKDMDVYVTGSNAYLLSGELATFLSGRYVELKMQPLSFREYCDAVGGEGDYARKYMDYLRRSSFPYAVSFGMDMGLVGDYLDGIYNTVLVKDVLRRKRLSDAGLVDRIARFLFDNIGNVTSLRNIAGSLSAGGVKTNGNTVEGYVDALCDAFLFRKAERYDIRGRELLSSGCKYYAADIGLRYRLSGNRAGDSGRVLENIVYLELLRRSNNVLVGQHDGREVDFVTRDGDVMRYYQVSESVRDEATRNREFAPLMAIRDHHPKTLITLDEDLPSSLNGIRQVNAYDFLLNDLTRMAHDGVRYSLD
ncbi:MAG: ATP-binding protein [Kiritimatiellae bacterium]|nr:ATP-binding protein [Kiritimatiellia bacterium]